MKSQVYLADCGCPELDGLDGPSVRRRSGEILHDALAAEGKKKRIRIRDQSQYQERK